MITILFTIAAIGFIIWLFVGKMRKAPLAWPRLEEIAEPTEIWLDGMDDLESFPQYGYHRYRDVYLNMRRLPIIVTYPEIIDGMLAYHFVYVESGEEGIDLASAILLVGTDTPAIIKQF